MHKFTYIALAGFLVVGGCKDKPDTAATSTSASVSSALQAPSAPVAEPVPSLSPSAFQNSKGDPNDLAGLFARLASEKENRAKADPTVEKVFSTVTDKLGIAVDDQKQIAAFTVHARYCWKGVTKTDIHLVACEFVDAPSAVKGVETASITNKYLQRREVVSRRTTTLAIQQTADTPASAADAKKIKDAFLAL